MRFNRLLPLALTLTFAVLLVLFAVGVVTYRQRSGAEKWKAHTYRVLLETSAMRNGLAEAQTNVRGFFLTRDERFIPAFESHNAAFRHSLQIMLDLTHDNAEQQGSIREVAALHADWEAMAHKRIALRQAERTVRPGQSFEEVQPETFEQARNLADRVRALLNQIDERENNLLAKRISDSVALGKRTEAIVFGGSILGFVVMAALSFLVLANMRQLMKASRVLEKENAERRRIENEVRTTNDLLTSQIERIEQRNKQIELLSSCGQLLQACHTIDEARSVASQVLPQLFPAVSGSIYLFNSSGNFLESVMEWEGHGLEPPHEHGRHKQEYFAPDDCWAIRCGQRHLYEKDKQNLACGHINSGLPTNLLPTNSLCMPMIAQGNVLGLLHLYHPDEAVLDESCCTLASAAAEQMGLAVANLQLRETLRHQSIRDPLTNLYNRRYLEESLEHELQRAARSHQPVGVVMLDIDHFKRFNDIHGHPAGDALLEAIGTYLLANTRGSDIACRYGGEELTLILPEATMEETVERIEQVRRDIEQMQTRYHGQLIGPVTISAGVAAFPKNGLIACDLLKSADAALYAAKAAGRNRVVAVGRSADGRNAVDRNVVDRSSVGRSSATAPVAPSG